MLRFLNRYLDDREAGRSLGLAHYLELFPKDAELIAREYGRMRGAEAARLNPAAGAASPLGRAEVGPYRLIRELGRGGQAVVYLAQDSRLPRLVALKVLREHSLVTSEAVARFRTEAEVVARLNHPGICQVYEAGVHDHCSYLAMRYVEGATLARLLARHRNREATEAAIPALTGGDGETAKDPRRTARDRLQAGLVFVEQAAHALHAAHEVGIIHRDVKPGNIQVTPGGAPVLLDFGLARDEESDLPTLTQTGDRFGTPAYMSPEQVRPILGRVDRRTDVYSLGVTLYELLTGRLPFDGPSFDVLCHQICENAAPNPRRFNSAISSDIKTVLETAMEKERDRRYQTAAAFAEDLRRARSLEPIRAEPASTARRLRRWAQRNPGLVGVLVLLSSALTITAWSLREANAAQASLTFFLLDGLEAQADTAWPELPDGVPRMQQFLAQVAAIPLRDDRSAARAQSIIAPVRARMRRAQQLQAETIDQHRKAWAAASLAMQGHPRYDGASLAPQLGLVPLGADPASGLLEFGHPRSGRLPKRDPVTQALIRAPDMGIVFVLIPGGAFTMGAQSTRPHGANYDRNAQENEAPHHEVELGPFFLAKFELTRGQLRSLRDEGAPTLDHLAYPATEISWAECETWLQRFGLQLPTEAQWEYATRAGRHYAPWWVGDEYSLLEAAANLADQSTKGIHGKMMPWDDGFAGLAPVGSFAANPFGLHDVHGNAWEWCRDVYAGYDSPTRPGDGLRLAQGTRRVGRGGGCDADGSLARSARRFNNSETYSSSGLGVRPSRAVRSSQTPR